MMRDVAVPELARIGSRLDFIDERLDRMERGFEVRDAPSNVIEDRNSFLHQEIIQQLERIQYCVALDERISILEGRKSAPPSPRSQ